MTDRSLIDQLLLSLTLDELERLRPTVTEHSRVLIEEEIERRRSEARDG